MRRKAVHLMAAIAESLRFFAVVFLAFDLGALRDASLSSLLRYAAAPQLLFAVGFFFLWLDFERYFPYKPLLIVGKAASLVCYLPLARALLMDPLSLAPSFGLPLMGIVLAFFIVAVDIASLAILLLTRLGRSSEEGIGSGQGPSSPGQGPSAPSSPGQGPGDIESVEGL